MLSKRQKNDFYTGVQASCMGWLDRLVNWLDIKWLRNLLTPVWVEGTVQRLNKLCESKSCVNWVYFPGGI